MMRPPNSVDSATASIGPYFDLLASIISTFSVFTRPSQTETTTTPCGLKSCAMSCDILSTPALAAPYAGPCTYAFAPGDDELNTTPPLRMSIGAASQVAT